MEKVTTMNDKEKAKLDVKIFNEEYGPPDFAPWVAFLVISSIGVMAFVVWFLWTFLRPALFC